MSELKPCPFCGDAGDPKLINVDVNMWYVKCCKCGAYCEGVQLSDELAIDAWNTRAERTCHFDFGQEPEGGVAFVVCSNCGWESDVDYLPMPGYFNYCPNCGAKVVN